MVARVSRHRGRWRHWGPEEELEVGTAGPEGVMRPKGEVDLQRGGKQEDAVQSTVCTQVEMVDDPSS